ncbi:hypothetical protein RR46_09108 [Papilio xuthus]|uniref:Uncharacterized protein n=1 Tax=Papilio xuthus TaxID=66420 RepID=A0A194PUW7_PAPXU|nr:hypothetical protein RR46_09108 [Papilio xuthus]
MQCRVGSDMFVALRTVRGYGIFATLPVLRATPFESSRPLTLTFTDFTRAQPNALGKPSKQTYYWLFYVMMMSKID